MSFTAYAPSTTFCIHVPMFDAKVPKYRMRKLRCRSARTVARNAPFRGVGGPELPGVPSATESEMPGSVTISPLIWMLLTRSLTQALGSKRSWSLPSPIYNFLMTARWGTLGVISIP